MNRFLDFKKKTSHNKEMKFFSRFIIKCFFFIGLSEYSLAQQVTSPLKHHNLIQALESHDLNTLVFLFDRYPWLNPFIIQLIKTDLNFAHQIKNSPKKTELLKSVYKKTSFTPTKIEILKAIVANKQALSQDISTYTQKISSLVNEDVSHKNCSQKSQLGQTFRELRKFSKSLKFYENAYQCYSSPSSKIKMLHQITLTHKLKHRGKHFINSSKRYYKFSQKAFKNNKITAQYFNTIGLQHVRVLWTYLSPHAAEKILKNMISLIRGKYSLQSVYWIKARILEERKKFIGSQKYLNLALKEKKISDADLISIYWQKFWNYMELNQIESAEEALKASLTIGKPDKDQSRTHFWLIQVLKNKLKNIKSQRANFVKMEKSIDFKMIHNIENEIKEIKNYLYKKYPISFYSTIIKKLDGIPFKSSNIEDLSSKTYKNLPRNFDFKLYKKLHQTSMLATQSFLREYYSKHRKRISKSQRFLIKRMMARNGDLLELFIELENTPEICLKEEAPCADLFPTPYRNPILKVSKSTGIPSELIYSVIRQESTFNPLAKSWADARGLMQILPTKAKELSALAQVNYKSPLDLYNVNNNIKLGSYLLKNLYQEMNGSLVMTLCGYNAEKKKALNWYKTRFTGNWLKFIEEIPYAETRNYNKLILRNFIIYSQGNDKTLKPWFPQGIIDL